jgi:hypothetical protein
MFALRQGSQSRLGDTAGRMACPSPSAKGQSTKVDKAGEEPGQADGDGRCRDQRGAQPSPAVIVCGRATVTAGAFAVTVINMPINMAINAANREVAAGTTAASRS